MKSTTLHTLARKLLISTGRRRPTARPLRGATARLQVEALEVRVVPASVTIGFDAGALAVTGTGEDDYILLTRTGADVWSVEGIAGMSRTRMVQSFTGVKTVAVDGRAGNDV